ALTAYSYLFRGKILTLGAWRKLEKGGVFRFPTACGTTDLLGMKMDLLTYRTSMWIPTTNYGCWIPSPALETRCLARPETKAAKANLNLSKSIWLQIGLSDSTASKDSISSVPH